jgi:hypothetical protein
MNGVRTIVRSQETFKVLAEELEFGSKTSRELEEKKTIREMHSAKDAEVKMMVPGGNILSHRFVFSLTRLSRGPRKIHKQGMITKESKLIEKVVAIVSMMKEGAKIRVVDEIDLGVDQVGANESRKSHLRSSLSPGRKVMEPSAHDGTGNVALRWWKVDTKHTTMFNTVGEILEKMFACATRRKTRETVVESPDHFGTEDDTLKMTEKINLVQMRKMDRDSMITDPTILRAHSHPGDNSTGGQINGDRAGFSNTKLVPLLI